MARATEGRRADRDTGRELAVLADGPWAPRCYWRDELEDMQAASRRMGYPDDHPSAVLRAYRPTDQRVPHPHNPGHDGRRWRYHPPGPGTDTAEPAAAARVARAHHAVQAATASLIPAPRRPLDDETTQREQLHRIHHDRRQQADTARGEHEQVEVLW